MNFTSSDWWNFVRNEELKPALTFFPKSKDTKILEVGGGNGFQAKTISELGYQIISIDIEPRKPSYYNVEKYDATKLPYSENTFDLIITSLTLQHIIELDQALTEMYRVLKNDGIIIHIVPTSWWTIFTNFWHYCLIPKFILRSLFRKTNSPKEKHSIDDDSIEDQKSSKKSSNLKQLFFNPLGPNLSFLHEIFYFRKSNWKNILIKNGFSIITTKKCPIFSTGYAIFKNKFLTLRKSFAKTCFPTIICIVTKKS